MAAMAPKLGAVLETALYVKDLPRATRFYEETMGLKPIHCDDRLCALDCGPGSVLLLFLRGETDKTLRLPGGEIPAHDGSGRLHFAMAIKQDDLEAWESHLLQSGVPIEGRMNWPRGGVESLFSRSRGQSDGAGYARLVVELLNWRLPSIC